MLAFASAASAFVASFESSAAVVCTAALVSVGFSVSPVSAKELTEEIIMMVPESNIADGRLIRMPKFLCEINGF
jgi:hypothetical protein